MELEPLRHWSANFISLSAFGFLDGIEKRPTRHKIQVRVVLNVAASLDRAKLFHVLTPQ